MSWPRRLLRRFHRRALTSKAMAALLGLTLLHATARADVGVLLNSPISIGTGRLTGAGHTAVYLSNICPASPVQLRLCRPGEQGSVLSNYANYGEDRPYEWNIIPLSIFLYGSPSPAEAPLYASKSMRNLLQERARLTYFAPVCATGSCDTSRKANWRDTVATTTVRDVYLFVASTTRAEDQRIIAEYNARANVNHYNGFSNNCADFARRVLNTYFPGAIHADYINDFGMTSPKAVARSFTRYAERHPERAFYVEHFPQQPSTLPRTDAARNGTEELYHGKKWFLPITYLNYYAMAAFVLDYNLTARFTQSTVLQQYPSVEVTELTRREKEAKLRGETEKAEALKREAAEVRADTFGRPLDWALYKREYADYLADAVADGVLRSPRDAGHVFSELDANSRPELDADGGAWLTVTVHGIERRVGVDRQNILSPDSDPQLAYRLMLARIGYELRVRPAQRETLPHFAAEWAILTRLHDEANRARALKMASASQPAAAGAPAKASSGPAGGHASFVAHSGAGEGR